MYDNLIMGPEEMSTRLRALIVLAEDLGSIHNSHMAAHKHLSVQFQGIQYSFLISADAKETW